MLEARGVEKRIGWREVLRGVDLTLSPGTVTALFGPNGAGKSTLVRILAALLRPGGGAVLWRGRPLARVAADYRAQLGVVGHATYLYGHLTAEENLRFYGRLYGVPDLGRRAGEVLALVGLEREAREPVASFSRGMQQRLAIARALLHRPSLLLLDEPFTGLDQEGQRLLARVVGEFRDGGGAALLVSHDFAEAAGVADRYAVLDGGRVAAAGDCRGWTAARLGEAYRRAVAAPAGGEG